MSRSWWSSCTVLKYGNGFQIPGVFAFCGTGGKWSRHRLAVGLRALEDVVAPAHAELVQQIGEIRPRVARDRLPDVAAEVRWLRDGSAR